MKAIFINIIFIVFLLSCQEPSPVELTNESVPEVEFDIINSQAGSYKLTGYDSTGVVDDITLDKSILSYSGVKNTLNNVTVYKGYGEALFFDSTKPITNSSGKIVGYKTYEFGEIKIGNHVTEVVPFRLRYFDNFKLIDTLVGVKHRLYQKPVLFPSNLAFPYNKMVPISFRDKGNMMTMINMRMPKEIVGNISVSGERDSENFRINLSWNNNDNGKDEIVIGGILKSRDQIVPLFRVREVKNNHFVLPNELIRQIPYNEFRYLVFTFIRKIIAKPNNNSLGEIYLASQSIHNIWVEL